VINEINDGYDDSIAPLEASFGVKVTLNTWQRFKKQRKLDKQLAAMP
jgi:hypothetical protein